MRKSRSEARETVEEGLEATHLWRSSRVARTFSGGDPSECACGDRNDTIAFGPCAIGLGTAT